ncbi:ABC transporter ATP-binding protein [Spirulina sp. 06S082]|uniref:ABC transporter ATP-binding protein n=1 Tax=Spirulina sp. 06S082 TaxID=3110248 RepID=UPI002B20DA0D|nr:ABC transporter ATP-binding protein [Spirulina sp. 06S082]MEA5470566.1 ABC transporter ATP-binding protein [Spirulina sp. 06S082]
MSNQKPTILHLDRVTKKFATLKRPVVNDITLHLHRGEILTLLGPSGCGKTTLLRLIAGFEEVDEGSIEIAGTLVSKRGHFLPPEQRGVGMVFQDYALFPHLTVQDNIAFGLTHKGGKLAGEVKQRLREVLQLVGLSGLGDRYPYQISGGQQQRVALARALAPRPALVLLDEPLSNLDVQVRLHLRQELRSILKAAGTSAIFVTHDQEEALSISDSVGVMQGGYLEQVGTPEEVYLHPVSRFVAEFVTQANFIPARYSGQGWETEFGYFVAEDKGKNKGDLMVRQEEIILQPDESGNGVIGDRQFLGREHCYRVEMTSGQELLVRSNVLKALAIGTNVKVSLALQTPIVFPDNTFPNHSESI